MTKVPEPLTPPECDLRSQDWFALEFKRLRRSRFWVTASDKARSVSVDLWCEAYEQVPAASLPGDDAELSVLAGFGKRGLDDWLAVKDEVLSAWVLCSDGRYYHPTLSEVALKAWILKLKDRVRKKSERSSELLAEAESRLRQISRCRGSSVEPAEISTEMRERDGGVPPERPKSSAGKDRSSSATGQDRTRQDRRDSPDGESESTALTLFGKQPDGDKPVNLDPEFRLPPDWIDEAMSKGRLSAEETELEWEGFRAYWLELAGKPKGRKRDWKRTWINYVTSDICQKRVGARRRNNPASGGNDGRVASLVARTAERYR